MYFQHLCFFELKLAVAGRELMGELIDPASYGMYIQTYIQESDHSITDVIKFIYPNGSDVFTINTGDTCTTG